MKTQKTKPSFLFTKTLFVLISLLLLPIIIHVIHSVYYAKFEWSIFLIELAIAAVVLIFIMVPAYQVLNSIDQREKQSDKTRRNVAELIDHAADMILIVTPSGKIVQANSKACQLLGYSSEEITQLNTTDIDVECTMYRNPGFHHQLYMGKSVSFDTSYKTKTGDIIPIENNISVAGWLSGNHYMEIARDITRRRQIEDELNASKDALEKARNRLESRMEEGNQKLSLEVQKRELTEKRIYEIQVFLQNLVDSMPSVIIALDQHHRITQWNLEAEKVFNLLQASVLGKQLIDVMPKHKTPIFKLMRRSANGRKRVIQQIDFDLEDGTHKFNVLIYPLFDDDSNLNPDVVIRLDDITEKTRFDEILVQTEKMLSLGGLAAGMAHEINNPLGAILQSLQNIKRRLDPEFPRNQRVAKEIDGDLEKFREYLKIQRIDTSLEAIKEAGERAANIVSEMLSFARPTRAANETVDVIEVLEATLRLAAKDYSRERQFDFRTISIKKTFVNDLPKLPLAKNQLQQVLLNLLVNAAQALAESKQKKPLIHISVSIEQQYLRIDIEDNGPGMDSSTRKRIFEPFFSTKSEGKGTGLGLSVSYFIVTEQLGGLLTVDSKMGAGSRFTILLPAPTVSAKPVEKETSPVQSQLPF